MALPSRPRIIPQCSACLRSYAFAGPSSDAARTALRQQIRGKKKMPNNSASITVRLLKDVKAYGRAGSLVPIAPGAMRNTWYPGRIAEYVTLPEMKRLRLANAPMERDFAFAIRGVGKKGKKMLEREGAVSRAGGFERTNASAMGQAPVASTKAREVERLSIERSMELVEIFVPPRLEFYRQPIVEAKVVEKPAPKTPQFGGAVGDLMAARMPQPVVAPSAIYGSVSPQDVLVALRAVMADNEEAARVVLQESEIAFVDLPEIEGSESGRVKHVGDFGVEVKIRGSEQAIRRVVRVIPEEVRSSTVEDKAG